MWHGGVSLIRTSRTTEEHRAGCSKRLSSKAAASEEVRRTLRYVEPLSEARTPLAGFFSILLGAELNALSQRQVVTPVGGVRLPPHIGFPGIRAGFAPSAGFLFAPKGAADLRPGCTDIHIGDSAIAADSGREA